MTCSRSQGGKLRTVEADRYQETDNVSRDSGHSSGSSFGRQPDSLSLCDSVQSLQLRRQRPVILPRRSLQASSVRPVSPEMNEESPRRSLAYFVVTTSIVIGSLAILWSAYTKHSCHQNNSQVWDLQQLRRQLHTKVIGQNNPIGKLDGIVNKMIL